MTALRNEIESALDELIHYEEGMRFQSLAVVLAKQKWPGLIASERKNDLGLDAYERSNSTGDGKGKGLACSITPSITKISEDARKASKNFSDISVFIFATPNPVTNKKKREWSNRIQSDFGYELEVISREDIITSLMIPSNASLCKSHLGIRVVVKDTDTDLINTVRQAAVELASQWAFRLSGRPLIQLKTIKIDRPDTDLAEAFDLCHVQDMLKNSRRLVLEAPAGRGKTTTLIQLATQEKMSGIAFLIDLPAWINAGIDILSSIAENPSFQSRSIDADLIAKVNRNEHFIFLLNGWNEIAVLNSHKAVEMLRELDRNFPKAGIIVATRTHHIVPPLPGARRLRLLALNRKQRNEYLKVRLKSQAQELIRMLDDDTALNDLTRTPFILSEVATIFEEGETIPATKIGVLRTIVGLLEGSDEHRSFLELNPLFGRQLEYMGDIASHMTSRGAVSVSEEEAREIVHKASVRLRSTGQISSLPEPVVVLSNLCSHHILERTEYPSVTLRFPHQQFQEFYAALGIKHHLWRLSQERNEEATRLFIEEFVNKPTWAEPLRMVAEEVQFHNLQGPTDPERYQYAGRLLVEVALKVDLIFAAELAYLCGQSVWRDVRRILSERLRRWYTVKNEYHRDCALAGMLASGSDEFADIITPLLSSEDNQVRLGTYRAWPEIHLSSLGTNWQHTVNSWPEDQRVDLVSELLHNRFLPEVLSFAEADPSPKVKEAAFMALTWIGEGEEATKLLKKFSPKSLNSVVEKVVAEAIPASFRSEALLVLGTQYESILDPQKRIHILLKMAKLGDIGLSDQLKEELARFPNDLINNRDSFFIKSALDIVRNEESEWVSHWVANRVSDGLLWPENWMGLVTSVPDDLKQRLLHRIGSEDFKHRDLSGIIAVLVASADLSLVDSVFSKLCELHQTICAVPNQQNNLEWVIERHLKKLLRALPASLVINWLADRCSGEFEASTVEIIVELFSNVARAGVEPLKEVDPESKEKLHDFLKRSVALVLQQDDFDGRLKANLASALSQLGEPEDMGDLQILIQADIERVRAGEAAMARGKRGEIVDASRMSYAPWHIQAVLNLDSERADSILLDLLTEPEYEWAVAKELTRLAHPQKSEELIGIIDSRRILDARAGKIIPKFDAERGERYTRALQDGISRLLLQYCRSNQPQQYVYRLHTLAVVLAAVDGHGSKDLILKVISLPEKWSHWEKLNAAELLLLNGVVLPTEPTLTLLDSAFESVYKYGLQQQDLELTKHFICLLFFIDDPEKGFARAHQILSRLQFPDYVLGEIATVAVNSQSENVFDFIREVVANETRAVRLGDDFINAVSTISTPASRELLLSFIDPEVTGLSSQVSSDLDGVLATRIADLCRCNTMVYKRVLELSKLSLPTPNRALLAKVICQLDTREAILAGLNLIADTAQPQIPYEIYRQLETAFIEQIQDVEFQGVFRLVARAANDVRIKLVEMVNNDKERRKSAFSLLGQIEKWRIEYGRPHNEPRCPVLDSTHPWPPLEPM